MKNINKCFRILTMMVLIAMTFTSCTKVQYENKQTIKSLYKIYKDGEISECKHNGKTVYSAYYNYYDGGGAVYDKDGVQIGNCNYAWSQPDPICEELTECEVIYRVKDHIGGKPAVDKYNLGK